MKKLLLILLCMPMIGLGQNVNIPDANFKAYLVGNSLINTNGDTEIQITEANFFSGTIDCGYLNISNLSGIEAFTSLEILRCDGNQLSSLDINQNIVLKKLYCSANNISNLDISNNNILTHLECRGTPILNSLTNLNTIGADSLRTLDCKYSSLTNLDLTSNKNIRTIECSDNNLVSLDVSNCEKLWSIWTENNQLSFVNLSGCNDLIQLFCENNQLTSLDVSQCPKLAILTCQNNQITSLDLTNNINLGHLWCQDNYIDVLDLSNATGFSHLFCQNNNLHTLNVKNGNNQNWGAGVVNGLLLNTTNNTDLSCISVDDSTFSANNWTSSNSYFIGFNQYFSNNCPPSAIQEHSANKELLKVTDLFGREVKQTNQPLFYIYDDGTVEKRIVIE